MPPSALDLRRIREEVGSTPDDATIGALWDAGIANVPGTALAILRPRLADALTAATQGSLSVAGVISLGAPAQPTMLLQQVQRLEAALATDTGAAEPDTLGGVTVIHRRATRRGLPFPR